MAQRLIADGLAGRTLTVKLKMADFTLLSRQAKLPEATFDTTTLHEAACQLLSKFPLANMRVRLTGVGVSQLEIAQKPLTLFPDENQKKREKLEAVVRAVRDRFPDHEARDGAAKVTRAAALGRCRSQTPLRVHPRDGLRSKERVPTFDRDRRSLR